MRNDDHNVYPIRPAQGALFDEPTRVQPRPNGKRHLLKFGVRRDFDDGDVPYEVPVQLGLADNDVDRAQLARDATDGLPASDRECLRRDTGSDASGHARARFKAERDATVLAYFHRVKRAEGHEQAVLALFSLLATDLTFMRDDPPTWTLELFCAEKALLMETFCRDGDRRIELGESDESEDEQ